MGKSSEFSAIGLESPKIVKFLKILQKLSLQLTKAVKNCVKIVKNYDHNSFLRIIQKYQFFSLEFKIALI